MAALKVYATRSARKAKWAKGLGVGVGSGQDQDWAGVSTNVPLTTKQQSNLASEACIMKRDARAY